jgi:hypothetical protein
MRSAKALAHCMLFRQIDSATLVVASVLKNFCLRKFFNRMNLSNCKYLPMQRRSVSEVDPMQRRSVSEVDPMQRRSVSEVDLPE